MASATKVCRVCGKEYEACRSTLRTPGIFRWQEVACSPECGTIYLERINKSRGIAPVKKESAKESVFDVGATPPYIDGETGSDEESAEN